MFSDVYRAMLQRARYCYGKSYVCRLSVMLRYCYHVGRK